MIEFFTGLLIGAAISGALFVWLNRNQASMLDAAEDKVRDWKKHD